MHEISIAESIVEIAEAEARKVNATAIEAIGLRLGEFTTIVREALEFAFDVARQGTMAQHARLDVVLVPMVVECVVCDEADHAVRRGFLVCERCGFPLKIVSGEELLIDYVDVEEEKAEWHGTNLSAGKCS
jgi:hydrogenase nickel incorporation protein HypA/HybF